MKPDFYFKFENKFRGDENSILEGLCIYDSLIHSIISHEDDPKILDIGCGRGEFIQKWKKYTPDVLGIETDSTMAADVEILRKVSCCPAKENSGKSSAFAEDLTAIRKAVPFKPSYASIISSLVESGTLSPSMIDWIFLEHSSKFGYPFFRAGLANSIISSWIPQVLIKSR